MSGSLEHVPTDSASFHVNGVIKVMALGDLNFGLGGGSGIGGSIPIVADGARSTPIIRIKLSA